MNRLTAAERRKALRPGTPGREVPEARLRNKYAGGHRIRVTPVPIPNTEVKPDTADGTACESVWESRSLPAVISKARYRLVSGLFHFPWKDRAMRRFTTFLLVVAAIGCGRQASKAPAAAAGTGAGMLIHQLSLCDADPARRRQAEQFIAEIIDVAAEFQAPAIIGSMQGRWNDQTDRTTALSMLSESLGRLGSRAAQAGTILLYEPLNRYETNLCTTLQQGCELIAQCGSTAVRLLADLFHMNIEEASLHSALLEAGSAVGHLHFVDSNRQAAGLGHIDFTPIAAALKQMRWQGYASAEAFPLPDSQIAAEQTIQTWRRLFGQSAD